MSKTVILAIPHKMSHGGYVCEKCGHEQQMHESSEEEARDGYSSGGIAEKILERRKMAEGGLDDDQPPYRMASYSDGGEVDEDDDEFLDHSAAVVPDSFSHASNELDPASEDEEEEQEKGRIDLHSIMRAIRARHRGMR